MRVSYVCSLICAVLVNHAEQVESFQVLSCDVKVLANNNAEASRLKSNKILSRHSAVMPLQARGSYDDEEPRQFIPETSFGADAVPEGQRPVNEYLDVIRAPLFGWASEETGDEGLLKRLGVLYFVAFATVCYPIAGATFTQDGYELQKIAAANVGALGLVLALIFRLYSGWSYVGTRLKSSVIEFEETGWYDGDIEKKTQKEKMRDQLLYEENVKPVVDRITQFGLYCGGMTAASVLILNVALSANPMFDNYDPDMLQRLAYDDKLAETAQRNNQLRPAYCDSRYYRAVANGGQGCGN